MTFHAVTTAANPTINKLLQQACAARSITCQFHLPENFDFTATGPLPPGDLLYRVAAPRRGSEAVRSIEQHLLSRGVATFYRTDESSQIRYNAATITHQYHIFQRAGLPLPRTILSLGPGRELLTRYVEQLGGFPVILKTSHGSHGIGTIKVDSASSLRSIMDFMHDINITVLMQEYIDAAATARFIVVGNEVVDSIEYRAPEGDFRTNTGVSPHVSPRRFDASLQDLAVKAVAALDLEAGGVDVLLSGDGAGFLAEVNFPFNFARAQKLTGVDIAGAMVDFLAAKSRRLAA